MKRRAAQNRRPESKTERLEKRAENIIRADAKPEDRETLNRHDKVEFVPAGTDLVIKGYKYELNQITAEGLDLVTDATPGVLGRTEKDIGKLSQAYSRGSFLGISYRT